LYAASDTERNSPRTSCDCLVHRFGHAADHRERHPTYPTDLSDAEWAALAPLVPIPAWLQGKGGRPEEYCHRQMIDAVLYATDNGNKWRALPADYPPWKDAYRFFDRWKRQGLTEMLHDRLRREVRTAAGRNPEPSAGVIDFQSLRAAETVARARRGFDRAKLVSGTKRHVAVDTLGLLLAVVVTAAHVVDGDGAMPLLEKLRACCLRIQLVWADSAYAGMLIDWARAALRLDLAVVKRNEDQRGFQVIARRWVVERSLAWLSRNRRLVRDYERTAQSHEDLVRWAMTRLMIQRLGRTRAAARLAPAFTPRP
jgi:transposase